MRTDVNDEGIEIEGEIEFYETRADKLQALQKVEEGVS